MALDVALLRASWEQITPQADAFVRTFYERLFTQQPAIRGLFGRNDLQLQHTAFMVALVKVLDSLEMADMLERSLKALAERHVGYGVRPEHYPLVGEVLLATMQQFLGSAWTPSVAQAWIAAYETISAVMLEPDALAA